MRDIVPREPGPFQIDNSGVEAGSVAIEDVAIESRRGCVRGKLDQDFVPPGTYVNGTVESFARAVVGTKRARSFRFERDLAIEPYLGGNS